MRNYLIQNKMIQTLWFRKVSMYIKSEVLIHTTDRSSIQVGNGRSNSYAGRNAGIINNMISNDIL